MRKMTVLAGYASIFLLLATLVELSITPVRAADTWTVDDDGSADFLTIQEAINAASDNDTIQVASGIYYEHVVVNKSLKLIGNGSSTTIIDGNRTGIVVRCNAPDVEIRGFTVQNGGDSLNRGILLGSCVRNTICDCIVRNNTYGIELLESNSTIIVGNKIMNNSYVGILIRGSNNVIHNNLIANNSMGVRFPSSSSLFNTLYHNNFINNTNQFESFAWTTKWDNGAEGNYWSDYEGEGGEDLDGDGIGETLLPYQNIDWYPLMEPWSPNRVFSVIIDETTYNVTTFSNSTLASFNFSQPLKQISFNVTSGASGFCNVTIPKALLNVSTLDEWKVVIDGNFVSRTITDNATHTSIYFTYTAGVHKVQTTTRMSSTISIELSSISITLGLNVTTSGNITAEDQTGRPNVNVTIQSRPVGAPDWDTVDTVETDSNSNYTYTWTPETGGTHMIMTSWEGDEETVGKKSDVLTLKVLYDFEPEGVYIETNSTVAEFNSISAFNFSQPLKQISFNVTSPYGTIGYSNVTIPRTLLNVTNLDEWKVYLIDVNPFDPINRTVTDNATHHSIYFTYEKGNHTVQITTRLNSVISIALSSTSIDLGSSVTISGAIDPVRPNATVTMSYRPSSGTWTTLDTIETDENGNYTCAWTPVTAGIYEVMSSWEGDNSTLGDESDVLTLRVIESSTISIALSSAEITLEENVTISGNITAEDLTVRPNVNVTISYRLSGAETWTSLANVTTYLNGSYSYTWRPEAAGTYEVNATWDGDKITHGATSNVLTLTVLKKNSIISIDLSSTNITKGENVTISGNAAAEDQTARASVTVTILYKLSGAADWTTLDTVKTDQNGEYTCSWEPGTDGTYYIMARWDGDDVTFGNESNVLTLTVKEAAGIPIEIVIVAVVAIILIAAVVIYFVKFRKSR